MRKTVHRYNEPGDAHFLTFSCFRRQKFLESDQERTWLAESLTDAAARHDIAIWGYVFMPEHVHLLVKPRKPTYDISAFLFSVKVSVTRKALSVREKSEKPDADWDHYYDVQPSGKVHFRFWQRGGGYDRNIFSSQEIQEKLTYMHNNPVKRGLCATPSEWRWSSASFYQGEDSGPVKVETAVI